LRWLPHEEDATHADGSRSQAEQRGMVARALDRDSIEMRPRTIGPCVAGVTTSTILPALATHRCSDEAWWQRLTDPQ